MSTYGRELGALLLTPVAAARAGYNWLIHKVIGQPVIWLLHAITPLLMPVLNGLGRFVRIFTDTTPPPLQHDTDDDSCAR